MDPGDGVNGPFSGVERKKGDFMEQYIEGNKAAWEDAIYFAQGAEIII